MSTTTKEKPVLKLALPKGRMKEGIFQLLADASMKVRMEARGYRPVLSAPGFHFDVKILKPQNIVEMLDAGSRDIGFTGADWVEELGANLVELIDTKLDPVRIVAAAPFAIAEDERWKSKHLVVASEYEQLTRRWLKAESIDASFLRSYGATEVFPPEDADIIVDNTATGSTLAANRLEILDVLSQSTSRFYANPKAMETPEKREAIERMSMILQSVLEARERVMIEVNVPPEKLDGVIATIPAMREPTIGQLYGDAGYAIKAAVPKKDLPRIIPQIKALGGTDVVVTKLAQIVP